MDPYSEEPPVPTFAKTLLVTSLALLLGVGAAVAGGNTLTVVSPGMGGSNFKMRVTLDGVSTNQVWVQDNTPVCEPTLNMEWMHTTPGPLIFDADDRIDSLLSRSEAADPPGARVEIRCRTQVGNGASTNNVRCSYRRDDGKFQFAGTAGFNPNFEHTWRLELVRESAPGAADGIIRFFKNGVLSFERLDATNSGACFSASRMGTGGPLLAGTDLTGTADFDSFVSTR